MCTRHILRMWLGEATGSERMWTSACWDHALDIMVPQRGLAHRDQLLRAEEHVQLLGCGKSTHLEPADLGPNPMGAWVAHLVSLSLSFLVLKQGQY